MKIITSSEIGVFCFCPRAWYFMLKNTPIPKEAAGRLEHGIKEHELHRKLNKIETKEKLFFSRRFLLTGKPDYIIEDCGERIPVEFKSRPSPRLPYKSHVMQLLSYCLLVEETEKRAPKFGIIRYLDREFKILYTEKEKAVLLDKLREMRAYLRYGIVPEKNSSAHRCLSCNYASICSFE